MSEGSKTCAECNVELPADSVSSLCPKCLLKMGFETEPDDGNGRSKSSSYQPTFIPPTVEELAPHFPTLQILEVIGHGGMGVVYKARQTELDRIVALKILRPGIHEDPSFAERFQREARALARLNHPNIITVYDFGRRDSLFYFIMEYVDGTNLRHLERAGELNPAEALSIVPQVCSALQYAHDNGVVHRDIKPENILINKEGEVRIADFGLAKLAGTVDDAPLTGTWQVMGTPHYMAPEQFEKPTTVDHRADIYSLGVVIYELLTGELPLGRFPLPSQRACVDVRLDEVVLRSLDKEPARRYQHVTDVATAVAAASTADNTSATAGATAWAKGRAAAVGDHAKRLFQSLGTVRDGMGQLASWLSERRRGLGLALMWCGLIDGLLAIITIGGNPGRRTDEWLMLGLMSLVAAVIAVVFGRQLRRGRVGARTKFAAAFCVLPWFGFVPLSGIVRMLLAAAGLLAAYGMSDAANDGSSDEADFVDRAGALGRALWKALSLRVLVFTVLGIGGWCAICFVTFGAINQFWYRLNVPSVISIYDFSAKGVQPASSEYAWLSIDASGSTGFRGLVYQNAAPERNTLRLELGGQTESAPMLVVDLKAGDCKVMAGRTLLNDSLLISEETLTDWMAMAEVDTESEKVQREIAHLHEVILLMLQTRGICSRLSMQDRESFPTVAAAIESILHDERAIALDIIPVGRLLDAELFTAAEADDTPGVTIRRQLWAENLFMASLFVVWLIGLLRVCRILYGQLFKISFQNAEQDDATVAARWRGCSVSMVVFGLLAAASVAMVYWLTTGGDRAGLSWPESLPVATDSSVIDRVLTGYMLISVLVIVCGLAARPLLRSLGRWIGFVGGACCLLVLPFSVLTFPTGLAAWISLTDPQVRRLFRPTRGSRDEAATVVVSAS